VAVGKLPSTTAGRTTHTPARSSTAKPSGHMAVSLSAVTRAAPAGETMTQYAHSIAQT
jgi:hypothetical protein